MKESAAPRFGLSLLLAVALSGPSWADAKADLTAAAKKLGESKNYTWTTTIDLEGMPFKPGPTSGKWQNGGYHWISSEMMGNTSEVFLRGTNGVAKVEGEWKTESELPQMGWPGGPGGPGGRPPGGPGGPGGPGKPGEFGGRPPGDRPPGDRPQGDRPPGDRPPGDRPPGDRPQGGRPQGDGPRGGPGFNRGGFAGMAARRLLQSEAPHEVALKFAAKAKDLKVTDGAITGELPEDVVQELAMFGRRGRGGPGGPGGGAGNTKGWVKIKLANGQITKTILEIESEMRAPDGGTQTINAITTTEIKDIGTTQLEVPAAVKAKLEKAVQ